MAPSPAGIANASGSAEGPNANRGGRWRPLARTAQGWVGLQEAGKYTQDCPLHLNAPQSDVQRAEGRLTVRTRQRHLALQISGEVHRRPDDGPEAMERSSDLRGVRGTSTVGIPT